MSKQAMHGILIVFEGLDGVGKTTQIELLSKYLKEKGFPVVITSWNSSRLISKAIKRAKKARLLTPYLYSTLHAADFMYRLENIILPALRENYIVIADRYAYTGLARDLARNIERQWIENIYSLAPKPDISFYCKTSIEESLDRIIEKRGGQLPSYYEAGMDIVGKVDPLAAFREFQAHVASEYEWIRDEYGLTEIDTSGSIEDVHRYVVSLIEDVLEQREKNKNVESGDHTFPFTVSFEKSQIENLQEAQNYPSLSQHNYPGKLIVIESFDRQSAVRQANLLYNELVICGYKARLTLLGNSWIGVSVARKALKKTILSLPIKLLLSASEIALYYEQVILPALQTGEVIIMDGYLADLFAGYTVSGLQPEWFSTMYRVFNIKPDCTIFLDSSLRELIKKKSFRTLLNVAEFSSDEHLYDSSMQQNIIVVYKAIAKHENWQEISKISSEKELHRYILNKVEREILPALKQGAQNESLREVFELFSRFDGKFDHARKVAELSISLFDQTAAMHGYGEKERLLLQYAAFLHDIGHALSDDRHEEFTYEAIMRQKFKTISEADQEIVANIACLHRQPFAKMKFQFLSRLSGANQLIVKRLASLLRIADALDESGRQLVHDVRCYEEEGVVYVDVHAVPKARQERAAVLRKADMFERSYHKPVVVARNWLEKRARQSEKIIIK